MIQRKWRQISITSLVLSSILPSFLSISEFEKDKIKSKYQCYLTFQCISRFPLASVPQVTSCTFPQFLVKPCAFYKKPSRYNEMEIHGSKSRLISSLFVSLAPDPVITTVQPKVVKVLQSPCVKKACRHEYTTIRPFNYLLIFGVEFLKAIVLETNPISAYKSLIFSLRLMFYYLFFPYIFIKNQILNQSICLTAIQQKQLREVQMKSMFLSIAFMLASIS